MARSRPARPARHRGRSLAPVAVLALLLPAAAVTGLTAAPAYASSTVCGTPLADLIGQDCTAPVANVYRAKADNGYQDLLKNPQTTSDNAEFFLNTKQIDPDGDKVTFTCRLTRGATVVEDWTDCTFDDPADVSDQPLGNVEYTGLTPGTYTLSARAKDAAVDKLVLGSAAPNEQEEPGTQFSWEVVEPTTDTTPPDTVLVTPAKRWHLSAFLGVDYRGNEPLKDAECRLQGNLLRACDSSQAAMRLAAGDWTFTVAGIDFAGNEDPTPAVNRFTVPVPSSKLRASGGWSRGSQIDYFFGSSATTRKKGATLSAARPGTRSVSLVATKCPSCGVVKVSYGGKVLKKVDLSAPSTRKRQLVPITSWGSGRSGRVTVTVVSSGKPVTIEGLGFSRRG